MGESLADALAWLDRYTSTKTHFEEKEKYLKDNNFSSIREVEKDNEKYDNQRYYNDK